MKSARSSRLLVALLGVLTVVGAAVFNVGLVGQTLASWNDRVFGSSTFGTNSAAFEGFAQAVGARYNLHRRLSDSNLGGAQAQVKLPREDTVKKDWMSQSGSGTAGILAASMKGSSCASYYRGGGTSTCTDRPTKPTTGYSYGAVKDIKIETATVAGIDLLSSQNEISTSATCFADGTMTAGSIEPPNASLRLGPWISGVQLQFPPEPIVQGAHPAVTTRSATRNSPLVGYEYTATLIRTKQETSKGARSELRLQMMSIGKVTDEQKWSLDLVLAYAECGVGMSVPTPEWPVVDGASVQGAAVSSLASFVLGAHETPLCFPTSEGTQPRNRSLVDAGDDNVGSMEATPTEFVDSHLVESVSGTSLGPGPTGLESGVDEPEVSGETTDRADESVSCELDPPGPSATSPIDYLIDEKLIEEVESLPVPTDSGEQDQDVQFGADDESGGRAPSEFDRSTEGSTGDPDVSDANRGDSENGKVGEDKSTDGKTADEARATESGGNSETSDSAVDEARKSEVDGEDARSVDDAISTAPATTPIVPSVEPAPTPAPVQGAAPNGPTTPSRVNARVPFSMVATDGSVLGTATIRDISRSSGCVAVLLEIETSDGSGATHLNVIRARDFREVLPDGGTATVGSPTTSCGGGTSMPTSFFPSSTYTGWVTFDVVNGGNVVMLRPSGTAGWIFTLPSAPVVSVPTSVTTPPVTTEADVPDEESSIDPVAEAARPAPATTTDDNIDE